MKKILFLVVALAITNVASAQENVIKVNPLGLAFGITNAGYEFATNDTQSLTVSGVYFNVSDITGVGAGLEYRFYFKGEAIQGWHAGPVVGYMSLKDSFSNSASIFTVGGEVGHQWVLNGGFAIDVFGGYAAFIGGDNLTGLSGGGATFGVAIGYAW